MLKQNQLKFKKKKKHTHTLLSLCVKYNFTIVFLVAKQSHWWKLKFQRMKITGVYFAQLAWRFFGVVSAYLPHSKLIKINSYKKENLECPDSQGMSNTWLNFSVLRTHSTLACCSPWGPKESDTTKQLNWWTHTHRRKLGQCWSLQRTKHLSYHHLQKRLITSSEPRPSSSLFCYPKRNFRYHNPPTKYNFKNQYNGL